MVNESLSFRSSIIGKLRTMILADGSVSAQRGRSGDPLTTAQMCVLCSDLPSLMADLRWNATRATQYLLNCQEPAGFWQRPGDDWHTSISGWCLLALSRHPEIPHEILAKPARWILARQAQDGGFHQAENIIRQHSYSTAYACAGLAGVGLERRRNRAFVGLPFDNLSAVAFWMNARYSANLRLR